MRSPSDLIVADPETTPVELAVYARIINLPNCSCGAIAVIRYFARDPATPPKWGFDWPRCASCPGAVYAKGRDGFGVVHVRGVPMEPKYRKALKLMGEEDAFVASLRLGYRPDTVMMGRRSTAKSTLTSRSGSASRGRTSGSLTGATVATRVPAVICQGCGRPLPVLTGRRLPMPADLQLSWDGMMYIEKRLIAGLALDHVRGNEYRMWRPKAGAMLSNLKYRQVHNALRRLVPCGWVARLDRGLYRLTEHAVESMRPLITSPRMTLNKLTAATAQAKDRGDL